MAGADLQVTGLRELEQQLAAFPLALQKRTVRLALTAAGDYLLGIARAKAPTRSDPAPKKIGNVTRGPGFLRNKLKRWVVRGRDGQLAVKVGVRGASRAWPFYAQWVERGHLIVGRRPTGVTRARHRQEAAAVGGRVPPHPFLAPALETGFGHAAEVFRDQLATLLPQAIDDARAS